MSPAKTGVVLAHACDLSQKAACALVGIQDAPFVSNHAVFLPDQEILAFEAKEER